MNNEEQTLSIIKPDAVERNLQDSIKNDFESRGFTDAYQTDYISVQCLTRLQIIAPSLPWAAVGSRWSQTTWPSINTFWP